MLTFAVSISSLIEITCKSKGQWPCKNTRAKLFRLHSATSLTEDTATSTSGSSWRAACSRTRARARTGVPGTCRAAPRRSTGGPPTRPPAGRRRRSSTAGRGRCSRGWGPCDAGTSPRRPWSPMWGGKAPWFVPRSPGTFNKRGGKKNAIFSRWWWRKVVVFYKEEKCKSAVGLLSLRCAAAFSARGLFVRGSLISTDLFKKTKHWQSLATEWSPLYYCNRWSCHWHGTPVNVVSFRSQVIMTLKERNSKRESVWKLLPAGASCSYWI